MVQPEVVAPTQNGIKKVSFSVAVSTLERMDHLVVKCGLKTRGELLTRALHVLYTCIESTSGVVTIKIRHWKKLSLSELFFRGIAVGFLIRKGFWDDHECQYEELPPDLLLPQQKSQSSSVSEERRTICFDLTEGVLKKIEHLNGWMGTEGLPHILAMSLKLLVFFLENEGEITFHYPSGKIEVFELPCEYVR